MDPTQVQTQVMPDGGVANVATPAPAAPSPTAPVGGGGGASAGGGTPPPAAGGTSLQARLNAAMTAAGIDPAAQPTPAPAPAAATVPPVAPPAPTPPAGPTADQLQARLAQIQAENEQLRQYAVYGAQALRERQAQAQPQPSAQAVAAQESITGVPQFDRRMLAFIERDPNTGEEKLRPGAPPDLLLRYREYQQGLQEFFHGFSQDPMKYLGKSVEQMVEARAKAVLDGQLRETGEQQTALRYVNDNASWMVQKNNDGSVARNFLGQPQLTPAGQMFYQTVEQLQKQGVTSTQAQIQIAEDRVRVALMSQQLAQLQQQRPASPPPPAAVPQPVQLDPVAMQALLARNQFVQQAAANPGGPYTPPPAGQLTPSSAPPGRPLSLYEQMVRNAPAMGISLNS